MVELLISARFRLLALSDEPLADSPGFGYLGAGSAVCCIVGEHASRESADCRKMGTGRTGQPDCSHICRTRHSLPGYHRTLADASPACVASFASQGPSEQGRVLSPAPPQLAGDPNSNWRKADASGLFGRNQRPAVDADCIIARAHRSNHARHHLTSRMPKMSGWPQPRHPVRECQ
jgi:hypothetical protein